MNNSLNFTYIQDNKKMWGENLNNSYPAFSDYAIVLNKIVAPTPLVRTTSTRKTLTGSVDCSPVYTKSGSLSNRTISTVLAGTYRSYCSADFAQTFYGVPENITGEVAAQLEEGIKNQLFADHTKSVHELIWFGDTANTGSTFYSITNGVFKALEGAAGVVTASTVQSGLTPSITLSKIKNLLSTAHNDLKATPKNMKVVLVSDYEYDLMIEAMESNDSDLSFKMQADGAEELFLRGIKVLPVYGWEEALADTDNSFRAKFKGAAVYTHIENIAIATSDESKLRTLVGYEDPITESTYMKSTFTIGTNFADINKIAVHYFV